MAWLRHTVTVPPAEEPVTLEDVKAHCRVTSSDEDSTITAYLQAARMLVENSCGVKLITQTVQIEGSNWQDLKRFPILPLQSITSIKYLDQYGDEQTLDPSIYNVVTGRNPTVYLKSGSTFPSLYMGVAENSWLSNHITHTYDPLRGAPDAVRVTGTFGFGAAADVPTNIKLAIYLLVGGWNENRESIGDLRSNTVAILPLGVESLLGDYLQVC